jgi:hypothetical protein
MHATGPKKTALITLIYITSFTRSEFQTNSDPGFGKNSLKYRFWRLMRLVISKKPWAIMTPNIQFIKIIRGTL